MTEPQRIPAAVPRAAPVVPDESPARDRARGWWRWAEVAALALLCVLVTAYAVCHRLPWL